MRIREWQHEALELSEGYCRIVAGFVAWPLSACRVARLGEAHLAD